MNIPSYVKSPNQENYHEELNQTLFEGVGPNGYVIPTLTNVELTVTPIPDGFGGLTTVAVAALDGTTWYISDHVPPVFVGKINGVLRQFTTAAYP